MAFRQKNLEKDDFAPDVDPPDWVPDLSAQLGVFGQIASFVRAHPRMTFLATGAVLIAAFLVLAPIIAAIFYIFIGAVGYALWTRIKRLRMPRVIPLSHSAGFRLQRPRQDLTQLLALNFVAALFTFFGAVMALEGSQANTGIFVAAVFGGFTLVFIRMAFQEIRGRLYFQ